MKKRAFLTSVLVLAAAMSIDAGAALPKTSTEPTVKINSAATSLETAAVQNPFVLERPSASTSTIHAQHYSHASHASHSSHASSRY